MVRGQAMSGRVGDGLPVRRRRTIAMSVPIISKDSLSKSDQLMQLRYEKNPGDPRIFFHEIVTRS